MFRLALTIGVAAVTAIVTIHWLDRQSQQQANLRSAVSLSVNPTREAKGNKPDDGDWWKNGEKPFGDAW